MKLVIVGCGNIATAYTKSIKAKKNLELVGFSDLDPARAQTFATEHGGIAYPSLEAALADPDVDTIVNLTIFDAHYSVIKQSLEAGKHVYSEKPLALKYAEARELVQIAASRGLRLAGAPITFLGEAQQTASKFIRDGHLGQVRLVYAEVNWSRIEGWHPNPKPFYEVGPFLDVGVYPLAWLTSLFGPAQRVVAYAKTLYPNRVTKDGTPFTITAFDYYVANLEFDDGITVRLTVNFYVHQNNKQGANIEFHGDRGSLSATSFAGWFMPDSRLEFAEFGKDYTEVPLAKTASNEVDWARGLEDLSNALTENRVSRVTGEHAAHVVEILEAVNRSAKDNTPVALTSSFEKPALMDWVS
jgi:predicted dehydrogenase